MKQLEALGSSQIEETKEANQNQWLVTDDSKLDDEVKADESEANYMGSVQIRDPDLSQKSLTRTYSHN